MLLHKIALGLSFFTEQKCENKEFWCEAARPDCSMPTTRENCQKYCGLCGGNCKVSLDNYNILLNYLNFNAMIAMVEFKFLH